MSASHTSLTSLSERLQEVTEALASAHTPEAVFQVVLAPALQALNALSGAVLLVDMAGTQLRLAATQGDTHSSPSLWQDGPLDASTPAGDTLRRHTSLFFEHAGNLVRAYPDLEAQTGGIAAVATAVLPMFLGTRPLGVLILDFKEPHEFTADEQRFLTTLAAQCSVALDRARLIANLEGQVQQRTEQLSHQSAVLEAEQAAMQTFVEFTVEAGQTREIAHLARLALDTLQRILPGSSGVFYIRAEDAWQPSSWTSDLPLELLAVLQQGLPLDTPIFAQLLETQGAVFVDGWTQETQQVEHTGQFQTAAVYPVQQEGRICAVLSVALQHVPRWSAEQRALIRALGQSFSLLYDRIAVAEQLRQQQAEAEGRERVLELLASLTVDLTSQQGDDTLIQRVQEQVLKLLPLGHAAYWEVEGDRWQLKAYVNDAGNAELMARMLQGLPLGQTPTLDQPWTTGAPLYHDTYPGGTDTSVELTTHVTAVAALSVGQGEHRRGVINFTAFEPHQWTSVERALLGTLARGLWLALERSAQSRALQENQAGLAVFADFTEAVGTESDVLKLAAQAVLVLQANLPGLSVAYHERVGELWFCRVWSEDVPAEVVTQMQQGVPATAPDFAQAVQTGNAVFSDGWDAADNNLSEATMYGAAVFLPLVIDGRTQSLMSVGKQTHERWSDRERRIVRAVAQSLTLALERAEAARQLQGQKEEAERRSQALEEFAVLSRDLASETNHYVLIRHAQDIMLSLLTPGCATYWEQEDDRWRNKAQVGDMGNLELQQLLDVQGLPLDAPIVHVPWITEAPDYQDNYDQGADTPAGLVSHMNTTAAFPVYRQGRRIGILVVALFDHRNWTPIDKAMLETAVHSLGLLLERAQGVEALEQSNRDLQGANEELEAFAYSASHDLRTPVRHVRGFMEMAGRALEKGDLTKVARHHQIVLQASDRMTDLIDAMLVLSRAGRTPLHRRTVLLGELVRQAQRDVGLEFPDQPVSWQVDALPAVQADPQLLQQVLTNLLSNAVKYGQGQHPLVVEVWAEERANEVRIFVRDNGVGFDPKYADKLFGVFQRLHRQEEFQGTGVGLATVRRLIARHGGRVWGDGQVNEGATFGFSLPQ